MVKVGGGVSYPNSTQKQTELIYDKFNLGVVTLLNQAALQPAMLKEAINIFLYEDGRAGPRWGVDWYGAAMPNGSPIDGGAYYQASDGTTHVIAVAGGVVYRSLNDMVTWSALSFSGGSNLTSGKKCYFKQVNNFLYITNQFDPIARYDGTTTIKNYSAITAPTGLVTNVQGNITGTAYTYYYKIAAVNQIGFSEGSNQATAQVGKLRASWDPAQTNAGGVKLDWTAVTGALQYDIYVTDNAADAAAGNFFYIDTVATNTYVDNGYSTPQQSSPVPTQNTSTGPLVAELELIGGRLIGMRDKNNPYRTWFTGSGTYVGYFADAYQGGYFDLDTGSQNFPLKSVDYQNGKGDPLITTFCGSADGLGCVWQVSLDVATFGNYQYIQPNARKLPGSRGTNAPNSVVNVLNNYQFFNSQGIYSLGPKAQQLNLLSTDELTANIRPNMQQVSTSAGVNVASYYYLAKVFTSVSYNGAKNNATVVYDTERQAYLPNAYTLGFERFFQYTDTSGGSHLLCWKPGDNRFSQTAESIKGDYGQPFATSLTTALTNTTSSRFDFGWAETCYLEYANPGGTIISELYGIERSKGYNLLKSVTISPTKVTTGWDTTAWDIVPWDYTAGAVSAYSEQSLKRYFRVNKSINAWQLHVATNDINAQYRFRTGQINMTPTETVPPAPWRIRG